MDAKLINPGYNIFGKGNPFLGFSIFVAVVCVLNLLMNVINGRFWLSDFKVYYIAAKTMLSGGQVYLQSFADGSGFYKYSPVILLFYIPYTFLSYPVACVIHFFILGFAFWFSFLLIRKIFAVWFPFGTIKHEGWLLSLAFVFILLHLVRELYLGNINILLLLLCSVALKNYLSGKNLQGSILLAIVVLTKPFFLLLIIPLVLRKKTKALISLAISLGVGLLLPFIYLGADRTLNLYNDWLKTMLMHDQGFPGMNSIDYLLAYYFGLEPAPGRMTEIIIVTAGIIFSAFVIMNRLKERRSRERSDLPSGNLIFEWFLIIALIPDIVKTDSEHFLSTAPLFIFMIYIIAAKRKMWLIPVLVVLFFFYGANSYDLLGRELSQKLFSMGLLGLSNLLLVILATLLYLDFRKEGSYSG